MLPPQSGLPPPVLSATSELRIVSAPSASSTPPPDVPELPATVTKSSSIAPEKLDTPPPGPDAVLALTVVFTTVTLVLVPVRPPPRKPDLL